MPEQCEQHVPHLDSYPCFLFLSADILSPLQTKPFSLLQTLLEARFSLGACCSLTKVLRAVPQTEALEELPRMSLLRKQRQRAQTVTSAKCTGVPSIGWWGIHAQKMAQVCKMTKKLHVLPKGSTDI